MSRTSLARGLLERVCSSKSHCPHHSSENVPIKVAKLSTGLSVMTTAVADFEFTTPACPQRHSEAAQALGAEIPISASSDYISRTLCDQLRSFMSDFKVPNGLKEMGFGTEHIGSLTELRS